jgi:hypothetical protein
VLEVAEESDNPEIAAIAESLFLSTTGNFDNDLGAIAATASFVICPRFPLPERAVVFLCAENRHRLDHGLG